MKKFLPCILLMFSCILINAQTGFQIVPDYRKGIKKNVLTEAKKLSDINSGYPTSWIKECQSVEIKLKNVKGDSLLALSQSAILNREQKKLLSKAELGDQVFFKITYFPYEKVKGKDPRYIKFNYTLIPEKQASYPGGWDAADNFLTSQGIEVIVRQQDVLKQWAKFGFEIDIEGKVNSIEVDQSTGDPSYDLQIRQILEGMPSWQPAIDDEGKKIAQKYYLMVGMAGC